MDPQHDRLYLDDQELIARPHIIVGDISDAEAWGQERRPPYAVLSLITSEEIEAFAMDFAEFFTFARSKLWVDVADVPDGVNYTHALTPFQARRIAAWVRSLPPVEVLFIHCAAGYSRSPAAAAAIAKAWGLDHFRYLASSRYNPNTHVYDLLCRALEEE